MHIHAALPEDLGHGMNVSKLCCANVFPYNAATDRFLWAQVSGVSPTPHLVVPEDPILQHEETVPPSLAEVDILDEDPGDNLPRNIQGSHH